MQIFFNYDFSLHLCTKHGLNIVHISKLTLIIFLFILVQFRVIVVDPYLVPSPNSLFIDLLVKVCIVINHFYSNTHF